jgi:hypothetical protein
MQILTALDAAVQNLTARMFERAKVASDFLASQYPPSIGSSVLD